MTDVPQATIAALYRYPVKGLTAEHLDRVSLEAGQTMPFDRAFAIENGPGPFDPADPKHLPKMHFLMLMRNEQLASLQSSFDDATCTLRLMRDGKQLAEGDLRLAEDRKSIEAALQTIIDTGLRGAPKIVSAPGHSFSDVAAKCVHVINLASVRALESAMGVAIDPRRFRANVVLDGWPAWSEFQTVGSVIAAGTARLEIFKRTERCAATNVDPATAVRDLKIPSFLSRTFGHTDFGVYARVIAPGTMSLGDAVTRAP
jgi:uncharacterized protein